MVHPPPRPCHIVPPTLQVSKIFVDNPFSIALVKHKACVKCLDINASRDKLAVVDEAKTVSVYELKQVGSPRSPLP